MELVSWELKIVNNTTNPELALNAGKTIPLFWDLVDTIFSSVADWRLKIILANSALSLSN